MIGNSRGRSLKGLEAQTSERSESRLRAPSPRNAGCSQSIVYMHSSSAFAACPNYALFLRVLLFVQSVCPLPFALCFLMLNLCTLQCVPFSLGDPNRLAEIRYAVMHFWMFRPALFLFSVLFSILRSCILHVCVLSRCLTIHCLISQYSSSRLILWV